METNVFVENQCSQEKIADIYFPVIEDAFAVYQTLFGDTLLNIRLLGSVARGEAGPHSDIDFIAVLNANPDAGQIQEIEQAEKYLHEKYPFVARVDLEAVPTEGLSEFRRFIFGIDSVSLFGSDTYTLQSQIMDRQHLAHMVTPDLEEIVKSYRNAVQSAESEDADHLLFYSRIIGKDILKCLRRISLLKGGEYERNIGRIYHQLLHYAPEREELLHELFDLYDNPSSDRERLLKALHDVQIQFAST